MRLLYHAIPSHSPAGSAGVDDSRHLMNAMGGLEIKRMPSTLALALGAADATPSQMATGFATIINGGHRIQPYFIERIYNFDNETIYQANPQQACHFALMKIFRQLMPNCLNYLKPINQRFLQTRLAHQLAIDYNQEALNNMSLPLKHPRAFPPNGL